MGGCVTDQPVEGITVTEVGDRVVIEVEGGRWEGSASEAERVFTRLHYAVARTRPGTNIASMFLDGELWGGKFFTADRATAIRVMRETLNQLTARLDDLERHADGEDVPLT